MNDLSDATHLLTKGQRGMKKRVVELQGLPIRPPARLRVFAYCSSGYGGISEMETQIMHGEMFTLSMSLLHFCP